MAGGLSGTGGSMLGLCTSADLFLDLGAFWVVDWALNVLRIAAVLR